MSLDLAPSIRAALIADATVAANMDAYKGQPAVFTRRPIPADAPERCIIVNPDSAIGDADLLNASLPIVRRDVIVYGQQPDDYRIVEATAYAIRELFHRRKWSIDPEGYDVVNITASGPTPAPTDSTDEVARRVGLTIELRRQT